jgi:hypothetical protein
VSVWGPQRCTSTSSLASTMLDLNIIEPLWPVADSTVISTALLHHLSSNQKMFFMDSGTVFHWRLFRTCISLLQQGHKLYHSQMVAQLRINNEMCIFRKCFLYFVHPLYVRH